MKQQKKNQTLQGEIKTLETKINDLNKQKNIKFDDNQAIYKDNNKANDDKAIHDDKQENINTLESNQNGAEKEQNEEMLATNKNLQKNFDILKYTFLFVTIILLSALFYTVCKSDDKITEAKDDEEVSNEKANDFDQTDVPSKDLINVAPKVKKSKSKEIEEEEVQDGEEEEAVQEDEEEVHEEEVYNEEVHEEEVYEKEVHEEEEKQESVENGIVYIR